MNTKRYDSDLTDAQWAALQPLLDPPRDPAVGGRPVTHDRRRMADAILYQVRTGVQWRYLPDDFPPRSAVWTWFRCWRDDEVWETIMNGLRRLCRIEVGRDPEPSAVLLDAESVPSGRLGPRDDIGIDGGKRVKGRARHLLCDVEGLPDAISVGSAGRHDSRGGWELLTEQKPKLPRLKAVFADADYLSIRKKAAKKLDLKFTIGGCREDQAI
jgi:putative transposase